MPLEPRSSALATWPERAEFNLRNFKNEINQHGYEVRWSKAMLCPNRDPNQEDHHKVNCQLCNNAGFIYYDPLDIRALITSFGLQQIFMPESRYNPGTAYFTTLPEYRMSFWDRFELLSSRARFTQVVKPTTTLVRLKYPALSVVQIRDNSGAVVPANRYTVTEDGYLNFMVLPTAEFLAVSYNYRPAYIVVDLIHTIRDTRVTSNGQDILTEFPCQATCRLDFLLRDESTE